MFLKRGNTLILSLIYIVGLSLVSIMSFTLFGKSILTVSFWINLAACYVGVTALWAYTMYVLQHWESVKRLIPGYASLGVVVVVYLICVLTYSLVTGIADVALTWFIALHVSTLLLATIISGILVIYIRSANSNQENIQAKIGTLKQVELVLIQLQHNLEKTPSAAIDGAKATLEEMIEMVKYSDPLPPDSYVYNDHRILLDVEALNREWADSNANDKALDYDTISAQLTTLKCRLIERNQQILIQKS
ncbi:hypothetical protein ACFTRD_16770 [Paenibacillus sp. NPDC056933]|uniref:hypothetical protein n=1 Tax=Paenibacillus sp. NPDC056933 TaxID=3345968 RepID=UPI00364054D5